MSCNTCNPCCDDQIVENIPGPQGNAGDDGANGTDGQNAFTFTTAQFIMPDDDPAADVTVDVENSDWMSPTQVLYIQGAGYMEVQSIPDSTSVILQNLGYPGNTAVGNPVTSAKKVSPAGLQGPAGADGASGAPDDAAYILAVPDAALMNAQALDTQGSGLVEFDDGTNTVSTRPVGVASGDVAPNDGALTNGEVLFASATGIETVDDATARTNLGLGTAAVEDVGVADNDVLAVDDAIGLTNGQALFATASGVESLTDANALLALDRTKQRQGLLGSATGIDLNSGATDNAITISATAYIITKVVVENASINITTATAGVFVGAGGGGGTIAADQVLTALTTSAKYVALTLSGVALTDVLVGASIQFRVGTPQGAAATADVWVFGEDLS